MQKRLLSGAPVAVNRIIHLIEGAGSEHVQLQASCKVAEATGYISNTDNRLALNLSLRAGYVISLDEPAKPDLRAVVGVDVGRDDAA
jgi:hypothetical protein